MKVYTFGKKLQYYRKQKGMTQAELAEQLGKSIHHVTQIERGLSMPSVPVFLDICKVLCIPADCFVMDADRHFAEWANIELVAKLKTYNESELKTSAEIFQSLASSLEEIKDETLPE